MAKKIQADRLKSKRITALFTLEEYQAIIKKAGALRVAPALLARQYVLKGVGAIQQELFK